MAAGMSATLLTAFLALSCTEAGSSLSIRLKPMKAATARPRPTTPTAPRVDEVSSSSCSLPLVGLLTA